MNLTPNINTKLYGYNNLFLNFKKLYDNNILPNKVIFSGSNGIGKSTFAYHFTNYILSLDEENKYNFNDNIISENNYSYNLISKSRHPNFFLITNDDEKPNIQISKIREMINFTNKSSFNNKCKIILIDNVEQLNINSTNSLLKIIEEPNNGIYFFLIHNSKNKILDTLSSRCIKYNFLLNNNTKEDIVKKLLNNNFFNNLNDDFKNIYNSPGNIISLYNFFTDNGINENISISNFLKLIIDEKLYKRNLYIKNNLSYFIELYFNKNINFSNSKDQIYFLYKYFLLKISDCNKFNLDIENVLIEFNGKILNG